MRSLGLQRAGEPTELAETAGKTGEVGLPAPSRLAHSPTAQRGALAAVHGVPRWNFGFSRPRKGARAKKFSHAETFDVGLLYFWSVGQRYLGVNPLPRSRYLRDFCVCFFLSTSAGFSRSRNLSPFQRCDRQLCRALRRNSRNPSLFEWRVSGSETFSSFVQGAEQTGPGGGLSRS